MKLKTKKYPLILIVLFSCAVQGPIEGGPIDQDPPNLVSVIPKNYFSNLEANQKIILTFDELIDPISVRKSISISNQDYKLKVRGKRVYISPLSDWDNSELIDVYVSRELSDFQKNKLSSAIDLFFSSNGVIPKNSIIGKIVDINSVLSNFNNNEFDTIFDVGLYKYNDSSMELVKVTQSDQNLNFKFSAIENGKYQIVCVDGAINDIAKNITTSRYSTLSSDIHFSSELGDTVDTIINISNPMSHESIVDVNFINQYYVGYLLTNNELVYEVLDTIYNNYYIRDFTGLQLERSLELTNDFNSYMTDVYRFMVPNIIDTIPPMLSELSYTDSSVVLQFSEPLDRLDDKELFSISEDSSLVDSYFKYNFDESDKSLKRSITIDLSNLAENNIFSDFNMIIKKDIIRDLSGNTFRDSVISININNIQAISTSERGLGGLYGKVLHEFDDKNLVVSLISSQGGKRILSFLKLDSRFVFENLAEGSYFIQIYQNYKNQSDQLFPYYGGDWNPFDRSLYFSQVYGPFEVRSNWDVRDIRITLGDKNE